MGLTKNQRSDMLARKLLFTPYKGLIYDIFKPYIIINIYL